MSFYTVLLLCLIKMRGLLILVILLNFLGTLACPRSCTCSQNLKLINCANGGFTHLPRGLSDTSEEYQVLLLTRNNIRSLTKRDMITLMLFKEIDLTDNPLSCTLYNNTWSSLIFNDCVKNVPAETTKICNNTYGQQATLGVKTSHQYETTASSIRLRSTEKHLKFLWLILIPILFILTCIFVLVRKRNRPRIIHTIPMELNLLARQHDAADEEEITLFEMKEKRL